MVNEEDYKKKLSPEQYAVLRESATEAPFSGDYIDEHGDGSYVCAACGTILFMSGTKFDSGSGWPSFYDVAKKGSVVLRDDTTLGTSRTEVICATCDSHLGHVFRDAPNQPTGMRYCINSLALQFEQKADQK